MSDITIQTSAPNQLEGGQQPLSPDAEQKSRSGFSGSQVFPLSGKQGVNVQPGIARPIAPAANNREAASVDGMYVAAPLSVSVKPVDSRTIEGSYAGDHRAKGADAKMPNQPGPRDGAGQAHLNSKLDKLDAASKPVNFNAENVGG